MAYEITINGSIATFTITRHEMRNAVNFEVIEGLEQFIDLVYQQPTIAFAVITGEGDQAFCSGGDLSIFHSFKTAEEAFPMLERMTHVLYNLATLPVPVIALVNGVAVGGGCELATACDYRLVSSDAKAGFIQGTLAITSGWGGATLLFERNLHADVSLQLLSEANVHRAEELHVNGWATTLYEGDKQQALQAFLQTMLKRHGDVHRAYKKVMTRKWQQTNVLERMLEEAKTCSILWESDAHHEAVDKFLTRNN